MLFASRMTLATMSVDDRCAAFGGLWMGLNERSERLPTTEMSPRPSGRFQRRCTLGYTTASVAYRNCISRFLTEPINQVKEVRCE